VYVDLDWKLFFAPNIPRAIPFMKRGEGGVSRGDNDILQGQGSI
jgi:hypothetical protein